MNRPTLYDFMESEAKKGHTSIIFNLYASKERQFLNEGFSVQRLGPVDGYPQQHVCKVDWTYAVDETTAYKFLKLAASENPDLLRQAKEGVGDSVPPPYAYGYPNWEGK